MIVELNKTSLLGFNWRQKNYDERIAKAISQRFEVSEILGNLLSMREISLDDVENFLQPKIKTSLPDPFALGDMEKAVAHVIEAINQNKKITIFADYDVDGATSSSLLKRFFRAIGVEVGIYIPDRVLEGYGPNSQALLNLKKSGTDLVITVDCGTVAFQPFEDAKKAGLEIIVIDHHLGVLEKPEAIAVINPNLLGETFEHKNLCAAGVCFLFVVAINKKLRELGFYNDSRDLTKQNNTYSNHALARAQNLRTNTTEAEKLLWYYLSRKQLDNCKFRRQQPIGEYIVDFVCLEKKLIIELDGEQHGEDAKIKYDNKRSEFLEKSGYRVLRFWNNEIFKEIDAVLDKIFFELNNPSPKSLATSTLPQGEGDHPTLEGGSKQLVASRGGQIKEPNLLNLLDLVALGTVCDVMSLSGLNRAFVAAGLKVLQQRKNLGLRELCDLAALEEEANAYHLGFILGPRINAGGRIGKSDLGATLLSSEDEEEVQKIARELELLNKQRKDIEAQALEEAIQNLEKGANGFSKNDAVIFATSNQWHQGVIGIIASRLKDLYNRPVAVIAIDETNKKGKASCRSISGIDFGCEILNARASGLLLEGGGHAMAGGFSVMNEKIPDLHKFFCEKLSAKVNEITAQKIAEYDIALDLAQVNIELLKELSKLEPFGVGNMRPKFLLRDVIKVKSNLVGQTAEHVSCIFSSKNALGFSGNLPAIAFRCAKTALGELLLDAKYSKPMNVVGTLNINSWMGVEKVQMIIEDVII